MLARRVRAMIYACVTSAVFVSYVSCCYVNEAHSFQLWMFAVAGCFFFCFDNCITIWIQWIQRVIIGISCRCRSDRLIIQRGRTNGRNALARITHYKLKCEMCDLHEKLHRCSSFTSLRRKLKRRGHSTLHTFVIDSTALILQSGRRRGNGVNFYRYTLFRQRPRWPTFHLVL